MNKRGFTLIELIVVIGLIGILLSMATFGFSQYSKKSKMSSQTRLLYGDLMEYRSKALYEKKNWTFNFSAAGYGIYSSAITTVTPVSTVIFKYPVEFNVTKIVFDSRGMAKNSGTVCITGTIDAVVDSVVISTTRVQIGKRKDGANCAAANIDAQ
jgi:prepilin-type N-terminal cleavage/methylation domain-containing protein